MEELIRNLQSLRNKGNEVVVMDDTGVFYRIEHVFWSEGKYWKHI